MTIGETVFVDGKKFTVTEGRRCQECDLFKDIDGCLRTPCGTTGGDEVIFKEAK